MNKYRKKRVGRDKRRVAAAMDAIEDAIFMVDRLSMRLVDLNKAACSYWQQTREELLAVEPWVLVGCSRAELEHIYDELIANGADKPSVTMLRQRTDGPPFWVELRRRAQCSGGRWTIVVLARDITQRMQAEAALRASEARFRNVFEKAYIGMAIADLDGVLLETNESLALLLGFARQELLGRNIGSLTHPEDLALERAHLLEMRAGKRDSYRMNKRYVSKHGELVWADLLVTSIPDVYGDGVETVGLIIDISERLRTEAELRIAATAFESEQGTVLTDADGMILRVNKAFTRNTGYSAEEVVGRTPRFLQSGRHADDFYRDMWDTVSRTGGWQGEIWDRRKSGEVYPTWLTISAVMDQDGTVTNYIGTHHDISERKKTEERIEALAFFDQLTGLPNRILLRDRLKQAMKASGRSDRYCALLLIDLDNFKTLNDALGHDVGDLLLKQVALRLMTCVREIDTVARLGGDEFVIILASLSASAEDAAAATEASAEKILAAISQSYQLDSGAQHSSASIGANLFKGTAIPIDDLMKQADLAMYKAKAAGRNSFRFFDPAMEVAVKERAAMEADLRQALAGKQFLLHYQAQVTDDHRLLGAEVLVRWQHPQRGMVSPADFIPLAEESGLILPLGHWVLETACTQLAIWAGQPALAQLTLAVNVSVKQFGQADFVAEVLAILANTGANPARLKLELTESLLAQNVEGIIDKMVALKARGVGFSLDDFGTGYSSLSYLKRLPLDQLKIDQSFVRDVLIDPNDAAIARTVVALANSLGLSVIAEGVETAGQRDFLVSVGCHSFQGYLFGRPLPVGDFESFAQQHSVR
jgi:diguanylate cyclase (GGDEF)-like protein/PAS domain S-box-containing protein